jgi:hypothetical protein
MSSCSRTGFSCPVRRDRKTIAFVLLILFLRALVLVLRKRDPQQIVL